MHIANLRFLQKVHECMVSSTVRYLDREEECKKHPTPLLLFHYTPFIYCTLQIFLSFFAFHHLFLFFYSRIHKTTLLNDQTSFNLVKDSHCGHLLVDLTFFVTSLCNCMACKKACEIACVCIAFLFFTIACCVHC